MLQCANRKKVEQPPKQCVVYPTKQEVLTSNQGPSAGSSICFQGKHWNENKSWFGNLLYRWNARSANRDGAMPHIKVFVLFRFVLYLVVLGFVLKISQTYCRISPTGEVGWFLITSHNLSKAAWGFLTQKAKLNIKNYELGVLIFPELYKVKYIFSYIIILFLMFTFRTRCLRSKRC